MDRRRWVRPTVPPLLAALGETVMEMARGRTGRGRARWGAAASLLAASLLAGACSSTGSTAAGPSDGGTPVPATDPPARDGGELVMSVPAEATGWDPRSA